MSNGLYHVMTSWILDLTFMLCLVGATQQDGVLLTPHDIYHLGPVVLSHLILGSSEWPKKKKVIVKNEEQLAAIIVSALIL